MKRHALVMVVTAGLALAGSPAHASCAPTPATADAIAAASAAFVGEVVQVTNSRRWAVVAVVDVWKGEVADRVEVRGGPKDPPGPMNVASSVERRYSLGRTYLFVVHQGSGTVFRDNICSATTEFRPGLSRFDPDPEPSPSGVTPTPSPAPAGEGVPWWPYLLVVAAIAAGLVVLRISRSTKDP